MKKLALLTTALLTLTAGSVYAEDTGSVDGEKKGMQHRLDTDGDGVVSKAEFLAHAEERFSKIDQDGSGDISKGEGKAAHKKMRERKKEGAERRQERRAERKDSE